MKRRCQRRLEENPVGKETSAKGRRCLKAKETERDITGVQGHCGSKMGAGDAQCLRM